MAENIKYLVSMSALDKNENAINFVREFEDKHEAQDVRRAKEFEWEDIGNKKLISEVIPIVKCSCGEIVYCGHFTNECDCCGSLYNFNGTAIKTRK